MVLIAVAVCAMAGCSTIQAIRTDHSLISGIANAQSRASVTCARAHAGTTLTSAIFAGIAADQLRAAGMSSAPWSSMPSSKIIFICYGTLPNSNVLALGNGIYVDSSGQETPAAPLGTGSHCTRTATGLTCSLQSSSSALKLN